MQPDYEDEINQLWEINSSWWVDNFTEGADAEYTEQILPLASEHLEGRRRILDVGCGEGQVSRLAQSLPGVDLVVGIDPTPAQVAMAGARAPGSNLGLAGAADLPFADRSFDAAIACLVFEHITEMDRAVAEVARVLRPGGRFVFMLNHPLLQTPGSGWIDDTILDEQYWRIGPYLVEDLVVEEVEKDVYIPFQHRPLSRYLNALADAGLLLVHMDEPAPPPGFLARAEEYGEAATIPRLLVLVTEKLERVGGPASRRRSVGQGGRSVQHQRRA